jgi:lysophospholipase L1-like esterase
MRNNSICHTVSVKFLVFLALFMFGLVPGYTQIFEMPVETDIYPFIQYNSNQFEFYGTNAGFENVFNKLDSIIMFGMGQLSIVHFGGSHIQADMYTGHMRSFMQQLCYDCNAGRGLVTPYTMAHTNNPSNYSVSYGGEWFSGSIVKPHPRLGLGLSGLTVATASDTAFIEIDINLGKHPPYGFNKISVLHSVQKNPGYKILPVGQGVWADSYTDTAQGATVFEFCEEQVRAGLQFIRDPQSNDTLAIYGILLETDAPGIVYHTIGINGASLKSYLKAGLLPAQLKLLKPDLLVFSIGTNDANTQRFNVEQYIRNFKELLDSLHAACPGADILITVPNDSRLYGKYINHNTALVQQAIKSIAKEYGAGVWDFYEVMGGLGSMENWYRYGLARPDHIHFNKPGYQFIGELFFNAFLNTYNHHIRYLEAVKQKI